MQHSPGDNIGVTLLSGPASVQAAGNADYNLTGFSQGNAGGGIISESNTATYKKVYNATDLALALKRIRVSKLLRS